MANKHTNIRRIAGLAAAFGLVAVSGEAGAAEIAGWNAERPDHVVSGAGTAIQIGGGPTGPIDAPFSSPIGGTWSLRGIVGTRSFIAGELAYVGSAQDYTAPGIVQDSTLFNNGGEVAARLNLPIGFGFMNQTLLEPYVLGGVGYMVRSVARDAVLDDALRNTEDFWVAPLGGGITLGYAGVLLDTRVTYRPELGAALMGNRLFDDATRPANELAWTTSLGVEF